MTLICRGVFLLLVCGVDGILHARADEIESYRLNWVYEVSRLFRDIADDPIHMSLEQELAVQLPIYNSGDFQKLNLTQVNDLRRVFRNRYGLRFQALAIEALNFNPEEVAFVVGTEEASFVQYDFTSRVYRLFDWDTYAHRIQAHSPKGTLPFYPYLERARPSMQFFAWQAYASWVRAIQSQREILAREIQPSLDKMRFVFQVAYAEKKRECAGSIYAPELPMDEAMMKEALQWDRVEPSSGETFAATANRLIARAKSFWSL